VVLAAGASTRFGSPKQRLLLEPVLARVHASSVGEIVVVLGAYEIETSERAVRCAEWELGPGASLRCGLRALDAAVAAAVVVLADGPDLAPAAIDRIVDTWRANRGSILAASYGGVRGHPVLLPRKVWGDVPDDGARSLGAVLVPCDDLGSPGDVDVADDLPEWLKQPPADR
jgi:nicotine blue oxidoreductase